MHSSGILLSVLLASLVVWRLTQLLSRQQFAPGPHPKVNDDASQQKSRRLRHAFYSLSLWLAAPAAILLNNGVSGFVLHWLAIAGAALLVEASCEEISADNSGGDVSGKDLPCVFALNQQPSE